MTRAPIGRNERIESSLQCFSKTLQQISEVSDLIPSYKEDAAAIIDRLFVPNIVVSQSFQGDKLRLETPKEYRSEEYLGVIALMPGETVYLDEYLTLQTPKQREQMINMLKDIDPESVDKNVTLRDVNHREYATRLPTALHQYHLACVTPGGMILTKRERGLTTYQKPLLILNASPDYGIHPSDLGHELMHMIDWDSIGVAERAQRLRNTAWMENRGYHIGHRLNQAIAASSICLPMSNPNAVLSKKVDEVRASSCAPDGFTPTERYDEELRNTGLYFVIDPNFTSESKTTEPANQTVADEQLTRSEAQKQILS